MQQSYLYIFNIIIFVFICNITFAQTDSLELNEQELLTNFNNDKEGWLSDFFDGNKLLQAISIKNLNNNINLLNRMESFDSVISQTYSDTSFHIYLRAFMDDQSMWSKIFNKNDFENWNKQEFGSQNSYIKLELKLNRIDEDNLTLLVSNEMSNSGDSVSNILQSLKNNNNYHQNIEKTLTNIQEAANYAIDEIDTWQGILGLHDVVTDGNLVESIVKGIKNSSLQNSTNFDIADYYTNNSGSDYINVPKHKYIDLGNNNKFDISLKILNLSDNSTKNKISITGYSEATFHRNYSTSNASIDGQCLTLTFDYKDRSGAGLDIAVPVAQGQKLKDYMFGALINQILQNTDSALSAGESWNPAGYACNNAVRAYLYYQKNDDVLFPGCGTDSNGDYGCRSGLTCAKCKPYLLGLVKYPGRANDIYDSFEDSDLDEYFVEIEKGDNESWKKFFDKIQEQANSGEIIIGVIKESGHGHIVAVMPKSLYSGSNLAVQIGDDRGVIKPIALEAGGDVKEIKPFVGTNTQITRNINPFKYYKYTK